MHGRVSRTTRLSLMSLITKARVMALYFFSKPYAVVLTLLTQKSGMSYLTLNRRDPGNVITD
jgi:hypothetical protein